MTASRIFHSHPRMVQLVGTCRSTGIQIVSRATKVSLSIRKLRFQRDWLQIRLVGKVNGEVQVSRSFVVDPFSSQDAFTIHYIMGNDDLVKMANSSDTVKPIGDNGRQLMRFELGGIKG